MSGARRLLIVAPLLISGLAACDDRARPPVATAGRARAEKVAPDSNPFQGLRTMALEFRLETGMDRITPVADVHGLIVDWTVGPGATATIACLAEGTASMYLSGGGGIIGAGAHEPVRQASIAAIAEAGAVRDRLQKVTDVPLPPDGHMRFTLVTDNGLLSGEADTDSLKSGSHPLSPLSEAVQRVITAMRSTQQSGG